MKARVEEAERQRDILLEAMKIIEKEAFCNRSMVTVLGVASHALEQIGKGVQR